MPRTIKLSKGYFALIDDEDYPEVSAFKWTLQHSASGNYAYRFISAVGGKRKKLYLHRVVLRAEADQEVKIRDGNGLNCCKANLKLEELSFGYRLNNGLRLKREEKSAYEGVYPPRYVKGWVAKLVLINNTTWVSPVYEKEEEAALAYDLAVLRFYGNCSSTRDSFKFNFPDQLPPYPLEGEDF